jgi:hypothetical protein
MAFDETYRTYIITQYLRVTTFYHPDDELLNCKIAQIKLHALQFCIQDIYRKQGNSLVTNLVLQISTAF